MATYSTKIHGPAATAPTVTNKVAKCKVCHTQWQVRSAAEEDAQGCQFCGAQSESIIIHDESKPPQTEIIGAV